MKYVHESENEDEQEYQGGADEQEYQGGADEHVYPDGMEEDIYEDTEITPIPHGIPEEDAVGIMEGYIRDAYIEGEHMAFYSGFPTTYHSYMDHIDEIGNAWNQALEDAEGEDYSAVQLILKRDEDQYMLWIDILKGGSGAEDNLNQEWVISDGEELTEVLKLFYHTGLVYDCGMGTIY
jgi:hypothetical protein